MGKLIVILGITGNQGASVADVFLQEPNWSLRGITRDLTQPASLDWERKGVHMFQADVDKPESLREAFQGANVIFGVTDFWTPMYNPYHYAKLRPGQTINEFCFDLELKRGKSIADAAATVDLPNIEHITEGKYRNVYHFDAKAKIMSYVKETLPDLAAKSSELQLAEFATNWRVWRIRRPNKREDGTYTLLVPGNVNVPSAIVVPRKDTGHFVRALVLLPPGKTLIGYGSLITHADLARLWTGIMGVPNGGARQATVEEVAMYEGGPHGRDVAETVACCLEMDWSSPNVLHPGQIPEDIGCPTTSIETYLRSEDFSSMIDLY